MPEAWTTLPIHQLSPPPPDSIAVYEKISGKQILFYGGDICPTASANMPMTALKAPPKQLCKRKRGKYTKLLEQQIIAGTSAEYGVRKH